MADPPGILEVPGGGMPKDDRQWAQFLRKLNSLLKVSGEPASITIGLTPGSVPTAALQNIPANRILGNSSGVPGPVDALTGAQIAGLLPALTDADIPASIARDSEVAAAIATHVAQPDPHTQYLTQTEGDASYVQLSSVSPTALARIFSGTGTPEGAVTAGVGSLFMRTDGGTGTALYVKETGAGNTGWIPK